jgi:hypothetical protein
VEKYSAKYGLNEIGGCRRKIRKIIEKANKKKCIQKCY